MGVTRDRGGQDQRRLRERALARWLISARAVAIPPPRMLPVSALARMKAQLTTMPVIEQAKGILIARTGCDPDEAFSQQRRISQRASVPIRNLTARLVEQSITRDPADDLARPKHQTDAVKRSLQI